MKGGEKSVNKIDSYIRVALAVNSFSLDKPFSVNALAKKAKVHHSTAKKAVKFFINMQEIGIPQVRGTLETKPHERLILTKRKLGRKDD